MSAAVAEFGLEVTKGSGAFSLECVMPIKVLLILSCASLTLAACAMPAHYVAGPNDGYHDADEAAYQDAHPAAYHSETVVVHPQSAAVVYGQPAGVTMVVNDGYGQQGATVTVTGVDAYGSSDDFFDAQPDTAYMGGTTVVYGQAAPANVVMVQQAPWGSHTMYSSYEFSAFLQTLRDESFDNNRLEIVERTARTVAFYSEQVAAILACLEFENNRVEAAVVLYPRTVDSKNWHLIKKSLEFGASFSDIEDEIANKRPLG